MSSLQIIFAGADGPGPVECGAAADVSRAAGALDVVPVDAPPDAEQPTSISSAAAHPTEAVRLVIPGHPFQPYGPSEPPERRCYRRDLCAGRRAAAG